MTLTSTPLETKNTLNEYTDQLFNLNLYSYEINPCYRPTPQPNPPRFPGLPDPDKIEKPPMFNNSLFLFEIYPNPSSYYLTAIPKATTYVVNTISYTLYDITKRPVKTGTLSGDNKIYVGDLREGIYILHIQMGEYQEKQKVIIDRPQAE